MSDELNKRVNNLEREIQIIKRRLDNIANKNDDLRHNKKENLIMCVIIILIVVVQISVAFLMR